jgi:hypothetical protein
MNNKCIIILSEKSSGSSALMKYLLRYEKIHAVKHTRHNERETLFFTKAASMLDKKQKKLIGSEVPISASKAREQLYLLVEKNVSIYNRSLSAFWSWESKVMHAWLFLCNEYAPIFLEKSPHYLANWSNIELILTAIDRIVDIDFYIVGLVRHPLNTIYSAHRRWKWNCYEFDKQWCRSYTNLLKLKKILGDKCHIVKYEDMCRSARHLKPVLEFAGYDTFKEAGFRKPRKVPKKFKYQITEKAQRIAKKYGY